MIPLPEFKAKLEPLVDDLNDDQLVWLRDAQQLIAEAMFEVWQSEQIEKDRDIETN